MLRRTLGARAAWHGVLGSAPMATRSVVRPQLGAVLHTAWRTPLGLPRTLATQSDKPNLPVTVTESEDDGQEPLVYNRPQRPRRKPWYTSPVMYVLMIVPIFTFWLGNWQLRRLQWKLNLIDELDEKLRTEPLRLPRNVNLEVLEDFAFRLVQIRGRFDTSRVLFLGPRTREGQRGYQLVMPFKREGGGADILVNVGFVANEFVEGTGMDKRLKDPLPYSGDTTIVTLLPRIYPPSRFALPNEPQNNLWMQINPAQMAAWLNEQAGIEQAGSAEQKANRSLSPSNWLPFRTEKALSPHEAFQQKAEPVIPLYLEQVFDGTYNEAGALMRKGTPVGRPARIELRNQHMEYAVTWFSLSAVTSVMFIYMAVKGRAP